AREASVLYEAGLRPEAGMQVYDRLRYVGNLSTLAEILARRGEFAVAEALQRRALAAREQFWGPEHDSVAASLTGLSKLRQAQGDDAQAEQLLLRALAMVERTYGQDAPRVAGVLQQLALFYEANGQHSLAVDYQARATESQEKSLGQMLRGGSDAQKSAAMATFVNSTHLTISLHLQAAPQDEKAARLALLTIVRRKGRVLDAASDELSLLRHHLDANAQQLLDALSAARSELSVAVLAGPGKMPVAEYRAKLDALSREAERHETLLSSRSRDFAQASQPVSLDAVKRALPAHTALVELSVYQPYDFKRRAADQSARYGVERYAAYALHPDGRVVATDLGPAAEVDTLARALRTELTNPRSDPRAAARRLDQAVMAPIRRLTAESRALLLSPDGALNLVPFAALLDESGRYLAQSYQLTYLTSGRDVLKLTSVQPSRSAPLVIADPAFDAVAVAPVAKASTQRDVALGTLRFTPLPGTAGEAAALAKLLPQAKVLTGVAASESAMAQTHGPSVLHVATHGFFLADQHVASSGSRGLELELLDPAPAAGLRATDPLLRSGLGLAGANLRGAGTADGILTALEASNLDLWGTKLVVLSACETGVGQVANGQGVYGLRRALVQAGAETQLMTLWKVDDEGTRDLMVDFYQRLQAGVGRGAALRQAQLAMLASDQRAHPYFWASFITSGDWRRLEGLGTPAVKPASAPTGKLTPGSRGCGCRMGPTHPATPATWLAVISLLAMIRHKGRRQLARAQQRSRARMVLAGEATAPLRVVAKSLSSRSSCAS
ncbi:MAG TPA: CHAT domain-containing tetratricopeptide repeat protein, partial [Polyangiaceae bacterium]|nr:CHAT domain-containing tetratricopeptide repeat protein [Polyangiaceae bacterium]